ncbi:phosphotransferase family protein [Nocardioidaceae bacterium]|nr:phosphotransferase family protein [Nocardioidaceae bacterium]
MAAQVDNNPAGELREEDAFDVAAVVEWLRGVVGAQAWLEDEPRVRQFGGGASNLTYQLDFGPEGGEPSQVRSLILRRPPVGAKASGAHDMVREFTVQHRLRDHFSKVAPMIGLCQDHDVIGSDFYVMERVDGVILRRDLPEGMTLDEQQARALCERMLDTLVELHGVDHEAAGLDDLAKGWGYVERQVSGWSKRYRNAITDDAGDYERVMGWLAEHQPDDVAQTMIHNDYRFDNLVLDTSGVDGEDREPRIRALLDWEMATVGDPLMDLGGLVAYWIQDDDDEVFQQFRRQPTHLRGMMTRSEVVAYYCDRAGYDMTEERWRWYEVFGLFRLGVIAQQIYYRYFHGQTHNEAYAHFGPVARYLEQRCEKIIDGSSTAGTGH